MTHELVLLTLNDWLESRKYFLNLGYLRAAAGWFAAGLPVNGILQSAVPRFAYQQPENKNALKQSSGRLFQGVRNCLM
jgi:hypothetical protein